MAGATEVREFTVTCPPGTPVAAPQVTDIAMPARVVDSIRIRIPPGPNGFMGFAIGAAGVTFIPVGSAQFIVASDEVIDWVLPDQMTSGAWQVQMYNTGIFPHTIYLTFIVHLPDLPVAGGDVIPVVASAPPTAVAAAVTPAVTVLPAAPVLT